MNGAIMQISDSHFGTEVEGVVSALLTLARSVEPALVIVSGDVTQRARRTQFLAAERFFEALPAENLVAVPGNHDIPLLKRFLRPYRNWSSGVDPVIEPNFESDRLLVQCVNTTRWFRHKHGQVSDAQIARVAQRLRRAQPEQLRVVVTHHPVLVIRARDHNNLLRGHTRAGSAWMAAGADILMGGHIHLPYVRSLHAEAQRPPQRTWVVQAGTAVSRRTREGVPNSVNILRYAHSGPARCSVERWDYSAKNARFEQVHNVPLPLKRQDRRIGMGEVDGMDKPVVATCSDG